jgi:hypothetical protein
MALANTTDIWSAAGTVFIVVVMSALTVMGIWEHDNRKEEHQALESLIRAENEPVRVKMDMLICTSKLNLFSQTLPKGQPIGWRISRRNTGRVCREILLMTEKVFVEGQIGGGCTK